MWGKWSDHIGRRKAMLLGLLTYILGSLFCSLSPSINWLLTGRIIQAFGASVGSVITMTIMRDAFSERMGAANTTFGMSRSVAELVDEVRRQIMHGIAQQGVQAHTA